MLSCQKTVNSEEKRAKGMLTLISTNTQEAEHMRIRKRKPWKDRGALKVQEATHAQAAGR